MLKGGSYRDAGTTLTKFSGAGCRKLAWNLVGNLPDMYLDHLKLENVSYELSI